MGELVTEWDVDVEALNTAEWDGDRVTLDDAVPLERLPVCWDGVKRMVLDRFEDSVGEDVPLVSDTKKVCSCVNEPNVLELEIASDWVCVYVSLDVTSCVVENDSTSVCVVDGDCLDTVIVAVYVFGVGVISAVLVFF